MKEDQSSINDCGVGVTAGFAAGIKLQNLAIAAFTTIGNGISNFAAQNIGAGLMKEFVIATTLDLILRVVLVKVLAVPFGYVGIWAAWPIGWVLGTSLSVFYYKKNF